MSKRWSYQLVEIDPTWMGSLKTDKVQEELNRHGAQGWELVNVVTSPMAKAMLVFKKES